MPVASAPARRAGRSGHPPPPAPNHENPPRHCGGDHDGRALGRAGQPALHQQPSVPRRSQDLRRPQLPEPRTGRDAQEPPREGGDRQALPRDVQRPRLQGARQRRTAAERDQLGWRQRPRRREVQPQLPHRRGPQSKTQKSSAQYLVIRPIAADNKKGTGHLEIRFGNLVAHLPFTCGKE